MENLVNLNMDELMEYKGKPVVGTWGYGVNFIDWVYDIEESAVISLDGELMECVMQYDFNRECCYIEINEVKYYFDECMRL